MLEALADLLARSKELLTLRYLPERAQTAVEAA
jgi:hypothetical protein